jgi:hypothetical protein
MSAEEAKEPEPATAVEPATAAEPATAGRPGRERKAVETFDYSDRKEVEVKKIEATVRKGS